MSTKHKSLKEIRALQNIASTKRRRFPKKGEMTDDIKSWMSRPAYTPGGIILQRGEVQR